MYTRLWFIFLYFSFLFLSFPFFAFLFFSFPFLSFLYCSFRLCFFSLLSFFSPSSMFLVYWPVRVCLSICPRRRTFLQSRSIRIHTRTSTNYCFVNKPFPSTTAARHPNQTGLWLRLDFRCELVAAVCRDRKEKVQATLWRDKNPYSLMTKPYSLDVRASLKHHIYIFRTYLWGKFAGAGR